MTAGDRLDLHPISGDQPPQRMSPGLSILPPSSSMRSFFFPLALSFLFSSLGFFLDIFLKLIDVERERGQESGGSGEVGNVGGERRWGLRCSI